MTQALEDILGLSFQNKGLLHIAMTHPSLDGEESYQRLEFLGDRVLGLVIATWLYEREPDADEGQLNQKYSALVRGTTLATLARDLGVSAHIRVSASAKTDGSANKDSVLADIMEAIIGAIYMDSDYNTAEDFIKRIYGDLISGVKETSKDAKSRLQEWAQGKGMSLPTYETVGRDGPDHSPVFTVRVSLENGKAAESSGASKRTAEQQAAASLLEEVSS